MWLSFTIFIDQMSKRSLADNITSLKELTEKDDTQRYCHLDHCHRHQKREWRLSIIEG